MQPRESQRRTFSGARSCAAFVLSELIAQGIAQTEPERWCAAFPAASLSPR